MADYYPLIARAVAGLDKNTGENRRALYERARAALVAQLRGVDPPLEETEVTRERLALEESIRKVEAEAARRARTESQPQSAPPPVASPPPPAGNAPSSSPVFTWPSRRDARRSRACWARKHRRRPNRRNRRTNERFLTFNRFESRSFKTAP